MDLVNLRSALTALVCLIGFGHSLSRGGAQVKMVPIPPESFVKVLKLIKPQPGELRFHEIPWLIDVWEARKKAAKEGKPILVWSGAGGSPVGVC